MQVGQSPTECILDLCPELRSRNGNPMGDLEDVVERIAHHRSVIAIGRIERCLEGGRTSRDRPPIGLVRIINVDVEERWKWLALGGRSDHDQ
jgi:hypothetical protein